MNKNTDPGPCFSLQVSGGRRLAGAACEWQEGEKKTGELLGQKGMAAALPRSQGSAGKALEGRMGGWSPGKMRLGGGRVEGVGPSSPLSLWHQRCRAEGIWCDERNCWGSDPRSSSDARCLWLPIIPVSSRRPKPSTWHQSIPALLPRPCRSTSTLVRSGADRESGVPCSGGHTHTSSRVAGQVSAGDGRKGPVPSLLWLTQVCKFPFLQQSPGFLNPGHVMSLTLVNGDS